MTEMSTPRADTLKRWREQYPKLVSLVNFERIWEVQRHPEALKFLCGVLPGAYYIVDQRMCPAEV